MYIESYLNYISGGRVYAKLCNCLYLILSIESIAAERKLCIARSLLVRFCNYVQLTSFSRNLWRR